MVLSELLAPVRWLLDVPPKNQRPSNVRLMRLMRMWVYFGYSPDSVESYLLYKIWIVSLIIQSIMSVVFLAVGVMFDITDKLDLRYIQYAYPIVTFGLIIPICTLYATILFALRSDHWKPVKAGHGRPSNSHAGDPNPEMMVIRHFVIFLIMSFAMLIMWALPLYFQRFYEVWGLIYDFRKENWLTYAILNAFYLAMGQVGITTAMYGYVNTVRGILIKIIYPLCKYCKKGS